MANKEAFESYAVKMRDLFRQALTAKYCHLYQDYTDGLQNISVEVNGKNGRFNARNAACNLINVAEASGFKRGLEFAMEELDVVFRAMNLELTEQIKGAKD